MLNCESSEAKRISSIEEKIISKRSEHVYIEDLNIEAKRTGSVVILYLKNRKIANFRVFFLTKGKKRKGSIVNYRSFAITNLQSTNADKNLP